MMGGTVFFDSSHGDEAAFFVWTEFANAKDDTDVAYNGYRYVKPIINMLRYFGMDGININWETSTPYYQREFHKSLYSYAHSIGFDNFHLGIYTVRTSLTNDNVTYMYADSEGQVADIMLNYGGEYTLGGSVEVAQRTNPELGASGVWQGFWIVGMDRGWTELNADEESKKGNICLWGEHKDSRFWSYNSGSSTYDIQDNYQTFLERAFSGGNRNPLDRPYVSNRGNNMEWKNGVPPLSTFAGFAEWIPERSTVKGKLPFATDFILGNGDRYNYRGKKASGAWYNMAAQDVVPTYRWLVLESGQEVNADARISDAINVVFTHNDSYNGGSCIRIEGDASKASDIILYNTDLTPNDDKTYALIAIKGNYPEAQGEVESNLCLILHVNGAWKEYAVPNNSGKDWQEHRIELNLGASDVIDKIGLRVKDGKTGYDMLVGKIEINDGNKLAPAAISDLTIEKTGESPLTMDLKLDWNVDTKRDDFGNAYNDDANISHFVILMKDGASGKVREIGRTTQWAAFVGNVDVENVENPFFGVAAVSADLKTVTEPVWLNIEKDPNAVQTGDADPFGTYGESSADKNAEGYKTACKCRGVEKFITSGAVKNVSFVQTYDDFKNEQVANDSLLYHKVKGQVLEVKQGTTIDFTLKGFDGSKPEIGSDDDLTWCFVGGWMDFDGSGTFNYGKGMEPQLFWNQGHKDELDQSVHDGDLDYGSDDGFDPMGERVFRYGTLRGGNRIFVKNEGVKGKIKIPSDAHLGLSRLRIVWSDAWFAGSFGPTGKTNKGYTLDIDVNIVGDNVTGQCKFADTHDMGELEDWTVVTDIKDLDKVEGDVPALALHNGTLYFKNVDKAVVYTVDGRTLKAFGLPSVVSSASIGKGIYIIKMSKGNTIKNVKVVL